MVRRTDAYAVGAALIPHRITGQKVRPMRIFTHWADFFCLFDSRLLLVYIFHHVLHAAVQQPAKLIYRMR